MKVYPPHQDKSNKPHYRDVDEQALNQWIDRGWVLSLEESYGEIDNGLQEEKHKDKEEVKEEVIDEKPKRRGRPKRG